VSMEEAPSIPRQSSFVLAAQDPWPFADVAGVLYDVQGRKVAEWTTTSSASWPTLPAGRYIGTWADGHSFTVLVRN